jgi:gluconate 2-dehydrogenase gamma chain
MRRRQFLIVSAASIGGVLVYSLDRRASRLFAQQKSSPLLKIPLRFFTEADALIVAAAASRIFPSDDSGIGAREAGVVIYIDRQLAGPYGRDRYRYTQGPFEEGAAREFGYQGKATPQETYREGLKFSFLRPAAPKHDRGNVLRSDPRRKRRHGRLATGRISRSAHEQCRRNR